MILVYSLRTRPTGNHDCNGKSIEWMILVHALQRWQFFYFKGVQAQSFQCHVNRLGVETIGENTILIFQLLASGWISLL